MDISNMRDAIVARYSGRIHNRNVAEMPDHQIVAIYRSMIERGDPVTSKRSTPKKYRIHEPVKFEQTRMEI